MIIICAMSINGIAQTDDVFQYRRSSIYSILVNHTEQNFANEIKQAFLQMPVPDKYNDHDLSVKVINMDDKLKKSKSEKENLVITIFLENNKIASRLVGKWFNRDMYTGVCDMELVKERGVYDASEFDKAMAEKSVRREAIIMDAGEELIGNTFVLVNDIRYVDKENTSQIIGGVIRLIGAAAGAYMGRDLSQTTDDLATITESLKGFRVQINTFLYRLVWDEEVSQNFYINQYSSVEDTTKMDNFEKARGSYKLVYVGKQESKGSTTSFIGINEKDPILMVRKACQRALDENVADLQHSFEEFRTKSPLLSANPITAPIGLKEDINKDSRFEVLEVIEKKDGSLSYNRVGIIKPVHGLIWDNRFMASEEGAENANLGFTTFKKVNGGDFFPGMLIREISN